MYFQVNVYFLPSIFPVSSHLQHCQHGSDVHGADHSRHAHDAGWWGARTEGERYSLRSCDLQVWNHASMVTE